MHFETDAFIKRDLSEKRAQNLAGLAEVSDQTQQSKQRIEYEQEMMKEVEENERLAKDLNQEAFTEFDSEIAQLINKENQESFALERNLY